MASRPFEPASIFHPADLSTSDLGAFVHALRLAVASASRRRPARAELRLLHVEQPHHEAAWSDFPHVRPLLERWQLIPPGSGPDALARLGLRVEKIRLAAPDPVEAILADIAHHSPGLVVLSTHQRHGLDRWRHRAVAEPVARAAAVPTLFVPQRSEGFVDAALGTVRLERMLVPVVPDPEPQAAVEAAVGLADLFGASAVQLTLLHVGAEKGFPDLLVPPAHTRTMERVHRQGEVPGTILAEAARRNTDLIVMATRGHHGILDALIGSTTERVLRGTTCPLLAVPAIPLAPVLAAVRQNQNHATAGLARPVFSS
jgi:nucleotide-binding universal stress UspA family protein